MADDSAWGGILSALMNLPKQIPQGLFGLGIPQEEIKNAQGEVVFPTNHLERMLQGSAGPTNDFAAAFMGPGARGANPFSLQKILMAKDPLFGGPDAFRIMSEGKPVGYLHASWEPPPFGEMRSNTLRIGNISVGEGPNSLGPVQVRNIVDLIRAEYPNAKSISGFRAGGANPGVTKRFDLP